jgi:hypothetical protein
LFDPTLVWFVGLFFCYCHLEKYFLLDCTIVMFYWFEPVLYLDPVSKFQFPEITEWPGYFVEFADNVGDALTFKILKNDLITVLHRSMVRSAVDASHRNRRVSFKSNLQESLKLVDTKPSFV